MIEDDDDEPIAKKIKAALPSNEILTKFIHKIVDDTDITTLSWKCVCEMVASKYPYALEFKKYFIKNLVESLIVQKLIAQEESDHEILTGKAKQLFLPSDVEVKRLVQVFLHDKDLSTVRVESVFDYVQTKYQSFKNMILIEETVNSFLMQQQQQQPLIKLQLKEDDNAEIQKSLPSNENKYEAEKGETTSKVRDGVHLKFEAIELTQLGNDTNKIKNFYDNEGYMYSIKRTTDSTFYLRCKNDKMYNCKASVVTRRNNLDEGKIQKNHNHIAEKKHLDRAKFNKCLEGICRESPFFTPRNCYQEAKKRLRPIVDMNNIPSLKSFESLIYRCQKVDIPLLPKTIAELEKYITDPKYGEKYTHDLKGKLLFRGVWKGSTGNNVAFVSQTALEQVRKEKRLKLLMDGTFKVLPCHLKFRQLYIINVIVKKRCYPLAFILMEKKDTISYELIFEEIKALISSPFKSVTCMSDYEAATRKAIKKVFPEAKVYGCFFHYVQAITKAFKRYGLAKKAEFNDIMQKVSALALLPQNYVLIGFESIASNLKKSKAFARFADYWRKQWSKANISVYGLRHRTNNFAESLNKSINLLIGNRHPHIWRLINNLKLVEADKSDELIRSLVSGISEKTKKNKNMKSLNKKIKAATKKFQKHQNVVDFLEAVTFNENMQNHFKERIYIEGVDNEFSEFAEENEEEEVIPNDFREDSNFRLAHPRKSAKKKIKK